MQKQNENVRSDSAATVMLLAETREGIKTLLLRRNAQLRFAGGNWVFPGGKVDASDFDTNDGGDPLLAAKNAAVRETLEETGLNIERDALLYFSRWTPPAIFARRFDTQFFLASVEPSELEKVAIDRGEIHDYQWLSAAQGLSAHAAGELPMLPPTYVSLAAISRFERLQDVISHYKSREPFHFNAIVDKAASSNEQTVILYQGDAGYASVNASQQGSRHRVVMKGDVIEYLCDVDVL